MNADIIIRRGLVYDGTGSPAVRQDIAIEGKRVTAMGDLRDMHSSVEISAEGKSVFPGMIDVHTHTDWQMYVHPGREEALCQGITTEITGACGIGLFPLTHENGQYLPTMQAIVGNDPKAFASCDTYLNSLPNTGTNVAVQVSHSPLRMETVGCVDKELTAAEMETMRALTRQAFEEGAVGLSTGLAYYPASFGDTSEMVELCKVAARYEAPVAIHQRTAFRTPNPDFKPREEVLEFARRSGAKLQYSHYRTTPGTAGQTDALLEPIRRGLAEGLSVTADFYPYPVGAGYAAVYLPMWVMDGGFAQTMQKLRDPANRGHILKEMAVNNALLKNGVVLQAPKHPEYIGMSYEQIADLRGQEIPEMLLDVLTEEELNFGYRLKTDFDPALLEKQELDFIELLSQPYYMLGSDTLPGHMQTHPRSYGAFVKMLRLAVKYGMDLSVFANRTAGLPASLYQIKDRGILKENAYADLFICDPKQVTEKSDFTDSMKPADCMELVMVNGQIAVRNGKITGNFAGEAIRRNQ